MLDSCFFSVNYSMKIQICKRFLLAFLTPRSCQLGVFQINSEHSILQGYQIWRGRIGGLEFDDEMISKNHLDSIIGVKIYHHQSRSSPKRLWG